MWNRCWSCLISARHSYPFFRGMFKSRKMTSGKVEALRSISIRNSPFSAVWSADSLQTSRNASSKKRRSSSSSSAKNIVIGIGYVIVNITIYGGLTTVDLLTSQKRAAKHARLHLQRIENYRSIAAQNRSYSSVG